MPHPTTDPNTLASLHHSQTYCCTILIVIDLNSLHLFLLTNIDRTYEEWKPCLLLKAGFHVQRHKEQ